MKNVVVVANLTIKEEFAKEAYEALLKLHKLTHENDKGCIQYDLHKDAQNENNYTFVETWENEDCLDEHSQKPHFLEFQKEVDGKIESSSLLKMYKIV